MAGVRDNTVSNIVNGEIASFKSVGEVPLKSLKVNFSPIQEGDGDPSPSNIRAISGWTGLDVFHTGKNLFDINSLATPNKITVENGIATGTMVDFKDYCSNMFPWGKSNQLYVSAKAYRDNAQEMQYPGFTFYASQSDGTYKTLAAFPNETSTFTKKGGATSTTKTTNKIYPSYGSGSSGVWHVSDIQIELGSTETSYEPYNGTTVPVSWSDLGTVYGGWCDVITGEGEITHIIMSDTWGNWGTVSDQGDGTELRYKKFPYPVKGNSISNFNIPSICNVASYNYNNATGNTHFYIVGSSYNCRIYLPSGTDTNLQIQVTGELIEPIPFSFTSIPIQTLIGVNNIWSNADTVEA